MKRLRSTTLSFLALILCVLWASSSFSSDGAFKDLSAKELYQLIQSGKEVFLLNPLPSILFRQGHIPGSVNIRWHSLEGSPLLPEDPHTIIVTYCMGPR